MLQNLNQIKVDMIVKSESNLSSNLFDSVHFISAFLWILLTFTSISP